MRLEGRSLRVVAALAAYIIKGMALSVRWHEEGDASVRALIEAGQPFLLAFWHGRGVMVAHAYWRVGGRRIKILVSEHRDGELIAATMAHWGYGAVRGSTRRGAVKGARGMLRAAHAGYDLAISPDGPRGPREVLQEGVIELARISGLPIVPVTYSARWAKRFASWDGFLLPLPGARGVILWGEPLRIPRDADKDTLIALQQTLEATMIDLRQRADARVGRIEMQDKIS
ncbi:lysophospholipid acyltransferase family protein [Acidithiobacillus ferriphilus]|uniref:lysophospholipid acyltransferase family protein n=1 Tax=Acidithiobacillus ferriphilus TaxID=1689834 RepID=UPI00232D4338|nr:lysophospholipid acyltransferase family protein [Acidithiobacillus ferriphilus]WCE94541.1 lysophospholipid acyltransferase family protein [Acidithiobacillus ferriphilus]